MKLKILIQREYLQRIRTKAFVVTTLIGLLVILGLSFAPAIMDKLRTADKSQITVLETSDAVSRYLDSQLQDKLPNGEREFSFQAVIVTKADWSEKLTAATNELMAGKSTAVLEISPPTAPNAVIWHTKQIDMGEASGKVRTALQKMVTEERTKASGLSQAQLANIFAPVDFQIRADGLKAKTPEQQTQNMVLVYILLFMLYFSLIFYGMHVANGVIEEKSSRVMEMMLATVEPTSMMAAKIIGIGGAALTQYIVWVGAGIGLLTLKTGGLSVLPGMSFKLSGLDPAYLVYFAVFFILGFLLYAAMYAGIGATVSRVEDTNQAVGPMTFLIVIGFLLAMYCLVNPGNPWIVGLSYVPFFTPMVFFARIVLTPVSTQGIILGLLDMIVSIGILIWLAGKLYRFGVLMYGKVSWRDLIGLIRQRS